MARTKRKWLCERNTDLKNGAYYDTGKGMNSKTLLTMFGEDLADEIFNQHAWCNKVKVISQTCYEVRHTDPKYPQCNWARRTELIPV